MNRICIALFAVCFFAPMSPLLSKQIVKASSQQEQPFLLATKKARKSVVSILVSYTTPTGVWDRLGGGIASPSSAEQESLRYGRGSGFIISEDGYIVTNNHVIDNANDITVQCIDGIEYEAKLVGKDPTTDIALIKIEAKNLPSIKFTDSTKVEVGEWVIAIGNPFGFQASVSTGIVSADSRSYPGGLLIQDFFQTDAAINPGNSGGPLVNLDGDVIGMNTSIITQSGGYMGIGFAIPSNLITQVLEDLSAQKKPIRSHIGIFTYPIGPALAQSLELENQNGVFVVAVELDSPADKAGLLPGDVILQLQNCPIKDQGHFKTTIALASPGKELSLLISRDFQPITIHVTPEIQPEPSPIALEVQDELQVHFQPTIVTESNYTESGLLVTEINRAGSAYYAGLRTGQVLYEANGKKISTPEDLAEQLSKKGIFFDLTILHVLDNNKYRSIYLFR